MKASQNFLAFDLGASNGRALLGAFDGGTLGCEEVYHFPNNPVFLHSGLHWDVLKLFTEIKKGLGLCAGKHGAALSGIGIDTWAVDYGLLDRSGELIGNPYHYRDRRTEGMVEEVAGILGGYETYRTTGVRLAPINTICQLYSMVRNDSPQLSIADTFLMMPCLLNYFLSGEKLQEHSNVTTTGLYDIYKNAPAEDFFRKLGIPAGIIGKVMDPGTVVGSLRADVRKEMGLGIVPVVVPATHDTASAVVSVPADEKKKWAFLSCGTWSVLGRETEKPVTTKESYKLNITNAATAEGKYMTIANITGLWLVQECKRIWDKEGESLGYPDLVSLARKAQPFASFIDVDDQAFVNPVNMPETIIACCRNTGQRPPKDKGGIVRLVLESMAFKYKMFLEKLERLTGERFEILHMVGGGAQNRLLGQFTADALGIPVLAGPYEATALGNILMQMKGVGAIGSVSQGRALLRKSIDLIEYTPKDAERWNEVFPGYRKITGGKEPC
ncbi:MAG: rhamnulokinase family protein [Candidatus Omnitrophota bacterium]